MNKTYLNIKKLFMLILTAFLIFSSLYGCTRTRLARLGFNVDTASIDGPAHIATGQTGTYIINFSGTREQTANVNPAVTPIINASQEDRDGYLRGRDDMLSLTQLTVATGAGGTPFMSTVRLQLQCTNNKN